MGIIPYYLCEESTFNLQVFGRNDVNLVQSFISLVEVTNFIRGNEQGTQYIKNRVEIYGKCETLEIQKEFWNMFKSI